MGLQWSVVLLCIWISPQYSPSVRDIRVRFICGRRKWRTKNAHDVYRNNSFQVDVVWQQKSGQKPKPAVHVDIISLKPTTYTTRGWFCFCLQHNEVKWHVLKWGAARLWNNCCTARPGLFFEEYNWRWLKFVVYHAQGRMMRFSFVIYILILCVG